MVKDKIQENLNFLVDVGLLIPFNKVKLYHGRSKSANENEDWSVKINFNNASNATGNHNVNVINALSTAEFDVASKFANKRARQKGGTAEVHQIVPYDENSYIFNALFNYKIPQDTMNKLSQCLVELSDVNLTKFASPKYENRFLFSDIQKEFSKYRTNETIITTEIVDKTFNELQQKNSAISKDLVTEIAGAINARIAFRMMPYKTISKLALSYGDSRKTFSFNKKERGPINLEYVANILSEYNIVGAKISVDSATLMETIESYLIFDLNKVNTKEVVEQTKERYKTYDQLANFVENFCNDKNLINVLKNGTPEEIIEKAKEYSSFKQNLELNSGVGENFTVGEHTESVLRVFDNSFKNEVPPRLVPFIKFVILCHDLGKGQAYIKNKDHQLETLRVCDDVFKELNVNEQFVDLIRYMIRNSQKHTTQYYINQEKQSIVYLETELRNLFIKLQKREPSKQELLGLKNIAITLQTCDSGAYTRYGVTRNSKTGMYHKNRSDNFTQSFEPPKDLISKKLRLKNPFASNIK